jgi:hypothetical protein
MESVIVAASDDQPKSREKSETKAITKETESSSSSSSSSRGRKLYFGDFIGTEKQLQERLLEVCGKEAVIESIQLHDKGLGYAFVTFATHAVAQCVWDQFQKQKMCGKFIRVDWPYSDQPRSKKPVIHHTTTTTTPRRSNTFRLWIYPLPRDCLKDARGIHDTLVYVFLFLI